MVVQKPIVVNYLGESVGKVLDAGCGVGMYTDCLIEYAQELVALDIQKEQVKIVQRARFQNIKLVHIKHW